MNKGGGVVGCLIFTLCLNQSPFSPQKAVVYFTVFEGRYVGRQMSRVKFFPDYQYRRRQVVDQCSLWKERPQGGGRLQKQKLRLTLRKMVINELVWKLRVNLRILMLKVINNMNMYSVHCQNTMQEVVIMHPTYSTRKPFFTLQTLDYCIY